MGVTAKGFCPHISSHRLMPDCSSSVGMLYHRLPSQDRMASVHLASVCAFVPILSLGVCWLMGGQKRDPFLGKKKNKKPNTACGVQVTSPESQC